VRLVRLLRGDIGVNKEQQQPNGQQPYEAPHIVVIGTFDELTKVKGSTSTDGAGSHKSV
jgi:hypothetical protein